MINILIVDDDELMRKALIKIIKASGEYTIYEARNGCEALDIIGRTTIEMALIDLRMPKQGGIDTIRQIRQENQNMAIFIMSCYHNSDLAYLAVQYKVAKCLMKPIAISQIQEILDEYETIDKVATEGILRADKTASHVEQLIRQGKFLDSYGALEVMIEQILKDVSVDSRIRMINEVLVSLLGNLFPEVMKVYEEVRSRFELTSTITIDERLLHVWLFKIVDYIFLKLHGSHNDILEYVIQYIDQNICNDISLKDIVHDCNVSQGHISRIFKMKYSMTIMNYIHSKKLNIAKEYLCMTTLNGSDISIKVGYNDFSYFCKIFKKYENSTISQYRDCGNG